jgi:group II intron reverse transcriptase/maturase
MADAKTPAEVSTGLLKVMERAKRDPRTRILALAHLIDEEMLRESFERIRKGAAAGVDGVTKEEYGERLEENLRGLHERLKGRRYRHQPIRRVHIPKAPGKTRPIGVSTVEDKVVQNALQAVLAAVFEQDFLDCSYGFRRGRGAHDALRALNAAERRGKLSWVLEADIQSFFDSIDRKMLMEMLRQRIADESLMRLVGKCLHVGILDGEEYREPTEGTVQGSTLSPLLGNVYMHYVLDRWFEEEVKPRLGGGATLIRYADDFVIGFEREEDARRVMEVLPKRMARYGLSLHPEKTRVVPFGRPQRGPGGGKGLATIDFLGFTVHWRKTRGGKWGLGFRTRKASFRRALVALGEWCRRHRHDPIKEQHAALCRRLRGHNNYFGVSSNSARLAALRYRAAEIWRKWLGRRSQRGRMTWKGFKQLLKVFPLPIAHIQVNLWAVSP